MAASEVFLDNGRTSLLFTKLFFSFLVKIWNNYNKTTNQTMMENKSLLQPLLSNNDDDHIIDLQHPVVTTATNYQPPYVPSNFANVLNGM